MKRWDEVKQRLSRSKNPRDNSGVCEGATRDQSDVVHWLTEGRQGMKQAEAGSPGGGAGLLYRLMASDFGNRDVCPPKPFKEYSDTVSPGITHTTCGLREDGFPGDGAGAGSRYPKRKSMAMVLVGEECMKCDWKEGWREYRIEKVLGRLDMREKIEEGEEEWLSVPGSFI